MVQGTGSEGPDASRGFEIPGEPGSTIKNFGEVELNEDKTLAASVSFEDGNGGIGGRFLSNAAGGAKGLLPSTGGGAVLAALGAGMLLVSGGLLIRKMS